MSKKIYLSPSNQNGNTYATGGTNEMAQCDKIAAAAAKALKRCGFNVMVAKSGTLSRHAVPNRIGLEQTFICRSTLMRLTANIRAVQECFA